MFVSVCLFWCLKSLSAHVCYSRRSSRLEEMRSLRVLEAVATEALRLHASIVLQREVDSVVSFPICRCCSFVCLSLLWIQSFLSLCVQCCVLSTFRLHAAVGLQRLCACLYYVSVSFLPLTSSPPLPSPNESPPTHTQALEDVDVAFPDGSAYRLRKGDRLSMFPSLAHSDGEIYAQPDTFKVRSCCCVVVFVVGWLVRQTRIDIRV